MSRVGKQPISIPNNVDAKIEGNTLKIKGAKGELSLNFLNNVSLKIENSQIEVIPKDKKDKDNKAIWGLTRALISNMVIGVQEGFEKKLEIQGVGYKAQIQGKKLVMSLGFSHPVEMEFPEGVEIAVEKNIISIKGIDKYLVGETAAKIRSQKKPEPYKGKGIRYEGEIVKRKAGKKAAGK